MAEQAPPGAAPNPAEGHGLEEVIANKKAKVAELRARGVDPYPSRVTRLHDCAQVAPAASGLSETLTHTVEKLSIAGRLVELRDMGKSIFGRLADASGRAQVYFKKDALDEATFHLVKRDLHVGDYLAVSGSVFRTKTGEPTIAADTATMLAKALRPLPEKWHGLTDVEARYRQRHLDLIATPESREVFIKRAKIVSTIRRVLDARGYIEVETPTLLGQAGGAAARPFATHHNALDQDMVLRIATELPLKKLVIGLDASEIGASSATRASTPGTTPSSPHRAIRGLLRLRRHGRALRTSSPNAPTPSASAQSMGRGRRPQAQQAPLPARDLEAALRRTPRTSSNSTEGVVRLSESSVCTLGRDPQRQDLRPDPRSEGRRPPPAADVSFRPPTAITPLAKLKPGAGDCIVERFESSPPAGELANAYTGSTTPRTNASAWAAAQTNGEATRPASWTRTSCRR